MTLCYRNGLSGTHGLFSAFHRKLGEDNWFLWNFKCVTTVILADFVLLPCSLAKSMPRVCVDTQSMWVKRLKIHNEENKPADGESSQGRDPTTFMYIATVISALCPRSSPGKNTGVGCHILLWGLSPPRDQTWVCCIAGRFFTI